MLSAQPFAFEVLTKATLILGGSIVLAAALRRSSAAARHLALNIALTSALILPALVLILPRWQLPLPQAWVRAVTPAPAAATDASAPPVPAQLDSLAAWKAGREGRTAFPLQAQAPSRPAEAVPPVIGASSSGVTTAPLPRLANVATALWLLATSVLLARLAIGAARARAVAERGRPLPVSGDIAPLATRLAIDRPIRLVVSDEVTVPMTTGSRDPVVIVPAGFSSWPADRRRAVLLHELAHVRRRDCLTQCIAQAAVALYWFHPLAWIAEAGLRREAEAAADDLVLSCGTRPSDYAAHLLTIVRALAREPRRERLLASVSMASTRLEERVSAILEPNRKRGPMPRTLSLTVVATVVTAVALLGTMRVAAQTTTPDDEAAAWSVGSTSDSPETAGERLTRAIREGLHETARVTHDHLYRAFQMAHNAGSDRHHDGREQWTADEREPRSGAGWYGRAHALYRGDRYREAAAAFEKALELGYGDETAMYNAACSHSLAGDLDDAMTMLERAVAAGFDRDRIETDSDFHNLRSDPRFIAMRDANRAENAARRARGEWVEDAYGDALAEIEALEKSDSTDADDWYATGMSLHRIGEYDRAIAAWERARDNGPAKGAATYNIACALARKGEVKAALDALEQAVENGYGDPDHLDGDDDLDNIRTDGRFTAIRRTAEILELPNFDNNRRRRAFMAPAWAKAVTRYEAYVASNPRSGRGWFNVGFAALASDQPARAIEGFHKAFDLGYRADLSSYNLACAYARNNDKDHAFEWLDRALAAGGNLPWHLAEDPDMDSLRDDPRFPDLRALRHEVGRKLERETKREIKREMKREKKRAARDMERAARDMEREARRERSREQEDQR